MEAREKLVERKKAYDNVVRLNAKTELELRTVIGNQKAELDRQLAVGKMSID